MSLSIYRDGSFVGKEYRNGDLFEGHENVKCPESYK